MADVGSSAKGHLEHRGKAVAASSSDPSTSDSEGSRGEHATKQPPAASPLSRSRKRSRSLDRDSIYSNSDAGRQRRPRSSSQHKKKSKDEKKQKKKKHKKHKQKDKDKDKGEAAGPVQLSKFMQEDKAGKEGRYSAVSGKKIKMKVDKSQSDIDAARKRSELLAALNGFYD